MSMLARNANSVVRADALNRSARVTLYAVLLVSSFAYNFSFILLDYIRPFLVRDTSLTLADTALLYTAQASGVIVGSFLMPVFVNRLGSRALVVATAVGIAALSLICLHATTFWTWASARLLIGVMLAGSYVSATTMLANFFPPSLRGRLLAVNGAMFSAALLAAGALGALAGAGGWRDLIWLAIMSSGTVAILGVLLLPDDRGMAVYADTDISMDTNDTPGRWRDMWTAARWRLTATCLAMAGLNFCGYEFYSGFITTYLLNTRHFDASITGSFVMVDGIGMFIGNVFWGWVADRKGRRISSVAFGTTAVFIALFLVAPRQATLLAVIEFGYAICLASTSCWPALFAELFPTRLRPMGTSLFHGGHVLSLFAPFMVATITRFYSLTLGMALAPITFLLAALLWWSLPETLRTSRAYRGFSPDLGELEA